MEKGGGGVVEGTVVGGGRAGRWRGWGDLARGSRGGGGGRCWSTSQRRGYGSRRAVDHVTMETRLVSLSIISTDVCWTTYVYIPLTV